MHRFVFLLTAALVLPAFAACGDDDTDVVSSGQPFCGSETPGGVLGPGGLLGYGPAITFGSSSQALFVEIADDASERSRGLMDRTCLGNDWGMLFVYDKDVQNTFGMRNTLIPLSIAWIKADGTILEIEDMQPETTDSHASPEPYRYAIEANQGWFTEHGIAAGDVATIPDNLSAS